MALEIRPISHNYSLSSGTNTSQASTNVPESQSPRIQHSTGTTLSVEHHDSGAQKYQELTSRKTAAHLDSEKVVDLEIVEADGLKYSKPGRAWTETTNVPQEHLGFIQVVAFMINQSVGTGIFFVPGAVVLLTRSKAISIVLWIAGGAYSMLSACVFLEFSTALPYNGGPLIYFDEVFPRPKMLATFIFSWYWILLCAVDGNCVTAAIYILQLVYPDLTYGDINIRLAQFVGIVVNSVTCLLLYFLLRGCLLLNTFFAGFKVMLLTVFFVAGIVHACKSGAGLSDFTTRYEGANAIDAIAAMTYVLGSYEGWENTNYIAGEIKASKKTLKRAAFTALSIITLLYVLVTVAYLAVIPYEVIEDSSWDISLLFAREVFGGGKAGKVAVMLSSVTSVIFSTYTAAKVKQAIAWQRIIPFSDVWGKQDTQFNSPGGALLLHWIFTTLHIAVLSPAGDPWDFETGLFIYGFEIMVFFLSVGIFFLPQRMKDIDPDWKPMYMKNLPVRLVVTGIVAATSVLLLYSFAEPNDPDTVPRYWWPITLGIIMVASVLYWAFFRLLQVPCAGRDGEQTVGQYIGFEVLVHQEGDDVPDELVEWMRQAHADGGKRRLTYRTSGILAKAIESVKDGWKVVATYLG